MNTTTNKLTWKHIVIIILTLATAGIHLTLIPGDPLFTLNALGYLALMAAYFLPVAFLQKNHSLVRWAYMGYALVTIVAWLIMGARTPLGYTAKAIEVILIILLWTDRQS
jgi:hypothetical protein